MNWERVIEQIHFFGDAKFRIKTKSNIGGGCINSAWHISDGSHSYFVKTNTVDLLPMFEAEFKGLNALDQAQAIRVPKPIAFGSEANASWLIMEYLPIGSGSSASQRLAGEQLAQLHQMTSERFGFSSDNYIGSTDQPNDWNSDWIEFYRHQRLNYQLKLAAANGFGGDLQRRGEQLMQRLDYFFDQTPQASLLHGDLWGGNIGYLQSGEPVIFDPATYYGDREADLAMTELFGGFSHDFYAAYNATWPLDSGYKIRKNLYNLYHILNHANLFGGGYARQALGMVDRLLAEIR